MQVYSFTVAGMLGEKIVSGIIPSVTILLSGFRSFTEAGMLEDETASGIRPSVTIVLSVNKLSACMFVFVVSFGSSGEWAC